MSRLIRLITFILVSLYFVAGNSEVFLSGQLDIVFRNPSAHDYSNKTFAGYSNFDMLRSRIFLDAKASENITIFTQLIINNKDYNLYGAYLRFSDIAQSGVNLHVGFIPNTVGTWGPRTYSNINPLIGTPLIYNYHTALTTRQLQTTSAELYPDRGHGYLVRGLPIVYDACWNTGVEVYGSVGILDWSIGALSGAVSAPKVQPDKDIPQFTGKLGFYFSPEFNLVFSGFVGPYLSEYDEYGNEIAPFDVNDYLNTGGGVSLSYVKGYVEIHSEGFWTRWEHPYLDHLDSFGGYLGVKYKFATQWYLAVRGEGMGFSEIDFGPAIGVQSWDYPLNRIEFGIGYDVNRSVSIKFVSQITDVSDLSQFDDTMGAIQFATSF